MNIVIRRITRVSVLKALIGRGTNACQGLVSRRRFVQRRIIAGLTPAGAIAGPIMGNVPQGKHAMLLLMGSGRVNRVVPHVKFGMAAHV